VNCTKGGLPEERWRQGFSTPRKYEKLGISADRGMAPVHRRDWTGKKKMTPEWSISEAPTGELENRLRLEALDNGVGLSGLQRVWRDGNWTIEKGGATDGQCTGSMRSYAALATGVMPPCLRRVRTGVVAKCTPEWSIKNRRAEAGSGFWKDGRN